MQRREETLGEATKRRRQRLGGFRDTEDTQGPPEARREARDTSSLESSGEHGPAGALTSNFQPPEL